MDVVTKAWILQQREKRYRRTPLLRIQAQDQARAFVEDVGFCHLWPIKGIETPSLFHAIAGRVRQVPSAHDDPDLSKCWGWKDHALDKRWWYYGKLLRRRATLVSLNLLPAFYACSSNYGDLNDYLDEYRDGLLSAEAKQIYEALLEHGPLDTVRLRREAWLSAEGAKSRFDRALAELQVGLKVLPVGVARAGAWQYAFIYEIVQRHYPELPEQARQIKRSEARRALVSQYLDNVIAMDANMIARVFHVQRWTPTDLERTIEALIEEGAIEQVQVEGSEEPHYLSTRFTPGRP
jgi:hypothetical protein